MSDQQMTRVLAIRHGETAWNADGRIQGQLDLPLNATGRWQASRMAAALADEGIHRVYSSDLMRAMETAQPLAAATGTEIVKDEGLRERAFGAFQGMTFAEIEQRWPHQSQRWRQRDPAFGPEGGEVLRDFYERCVAAVTRLAAASEGLTIAVVAHGGVMDCLYRAATRLELNAPRTWHVGNASINRLLYTPQGLTLVGWSDVQHLEGQAMDEHSDGVTEQSAPIASDGGRA